MAKTFRDKKFHLLRSTFKDRMPQEKFEEMANSIGIKNNKDLILFQKEFHVRNSLGFMSNRKPFAHRLAGRRKGNMKSELIINRSKKRSDKHNALIEIRKQMDNEE